MIKEKLLIQILVIGSILVFPILIIGYPNERNGSQFPLINALFDRYHYSTEDNWGAWFEENYPGQFTVTYLTGPLTPEELEKYDLFVTYLSSKRHLGPRPTASEAEVLEEYVRNGGAAMLLGHDVYRGLWTNEYLNILSAPFNVFFNDDQLLDPTDYNPNVTSYEDDPEANIVFRNIRRHPTTKEVRKIWVNGTCSIRNNNPDAVTLVAGDDDTYSDRYPKGSYPPALVALKYGSGYIIFSGSGTSYIQNVYDNRAFLWDTLKWLSSPPRPFPIYLLILISVIAGCLGLILVIRVIVTSSITNTVAYIGERAWRKVAASLRPLRTRGTRRVSRKPKINIFLEVTPANGQSHVTFKTPVEATHIFTEFDPEFIEQLNRYSEFANAYVVRGLQALKSFDYKDNEEILRQLENHGVSFFNNYIKDELKIKYETAKQLSRELNRSIKFLLIPEGRERGLPWELMHDGRDFLCLQFDFARTRSSSPEFKRFLQRKLKVLIVGSNAYGDLEVEKEAVSIFNTLVKLRDVEAHVMYGQKTTKSNVIDRLLEGEYNILHFCGHSVFNRDDPSRSSLLFGNKGKVENLYADTVPALIKDTDLTMVFLNSCYSGLSSEQVQLPGKVTGIADAFIGEGLSYVIGMQWKVSDRGSVTLSEEFYRRLSQGASVESAMRLARARVAAKYDKIDMAWLSPVLYIR